MQKKEVAVSTTRVTSSKLADRQLLKRSLQVQYLRGPSPVTVQSGEECRKHGEALFTQTPAASSQCKCGQEDSVAVLHFIPSRLLLQRFFSPLETAKQPSPHS